MEQAVVGKNSRKDQRNHDIFFFESFTSTTHFPEDAKSAEIVVFESSLVPPCFLYGRDALRSSEPAWSRARHPLASQNLGEPSWLVKSQPGEINVTRARMRIGGDHAVDHKYQPSRIPNGGAVLYIYARIPVIALRSGKSS